MAFRDWIRRILGFGELPESYEESNRTYRDWSDEEYQEFVDRAYVEVYNNLPPIGRLDDEDDDRARELFQEGWLTWGEYSKEQIDDIRNDFYNLIGMPEDMFKWYDFRELYNEVNAG